MADLSAKRIDDLQPYVHLPWCAYSGDIIFNLGCTRDQALALRARAKGKTGDWVLFFVRKEPVCVGAWHEPD